MRKHLITLSLFFASSAFGADIKNKDSYLVKNGDTLWDIADYFLNDPWEWKTLWTKNPQIKNPDLIYPNDIIHLKEKNGEYFIELEKSVVKKSFSFEKGVKKRETSLDRSLPVVNVDKLFDFSEKYAIIDEKNNENKIIKIKSSNIITYKGDKVYIYNENAKENEIYNTYKKTKKMLDKNHFFQKTGEIKILKKKGDVFEAKITKTIDRISNGDILIKKEEKLNLNTLKPSKPKKGLSGIILTSLNKLNSFSKNDMIILNLGKENGVKLGNVFKIKSPSESLMMNDKKLLIEGEEKGLVLIYKVEDSFSYAVIVENNEIINKNDIIKSPF